MRITFNSSFDAGVRAISEAAEALADAQRQLATGRRVSRLSEDPLGAASAVQEHGTIDRLDAYRGATDAAAYRLTLADNVLTDIVNQLTAAQSTALSARGTTQNQQQRDAAANELLAIRDTLLADINTKFEGAYLFSGSNLTVAPYVSTLGVISGYQGDTDQGTFEIATGRSITGTFDGSALFQGSDAQHVLDALTDLAAAISANDQAGIDAGVQAVNRAFDRATATQSRVGNDLRAVSETQTFLISARNSAVARLSDIEDADMAQASAKLAQADTAYRAALAAVSTLGRTSLMDYIK